MLFSLLAISMSVLHPDIGNSFQSQNLIKPCLKKDCQYTDKAIFTFVHPN